MYLWLSQAQAREIIQHAMAEAPHESCGVIAGVGSRAQKVITLSNVADDPRHNYETDPAGLVRTMLTLESEGLEFIGFYHSHPKGDAIPSETDIKQAHYPDTPYLIVGMRHGKPRLAAWRIHNGIVDRVELHIGDNPADIVDDERLSRAQITAIIISALLAFVLMLIISLSLLPPPPTIPTG